MKFRFSLWLVVLLFISACFSLWAEEVSTERQDVVVNPTEKTQVMSTPSPQTTPSREGTSSASQAKTGRRYSTSRKTGAIPKKKSARGGKGAGYYKSTYDVPQFSEQADPNHAILYFYPPDRQVGIGDKPFATMLIMSNPQGLTFNRVFLAIKYDSAVLAPVEYEDRLTTALLKTVPKMMVYPKEGIITYSAELTRPILFINEELLAIYWKALLPQSETILYFTHFNGENSGIFTDKTSILGDPAVDNDGMIPASINILSQNESAMKEQEEPENFSMALVVDKWDTQKEKGDGSIGLALLAPQSPVKVGDTFLVDIHFRNPNGLQIDNVSLDIRFDPKVLQVVDYDEDNWITRDVNIYDGASHELYPFDYHISNTALNQSGHIIYKMGLSKSDTLYHEGTLATIKFYAVAPASRTV
ncbi:MAG: cohesin domain-containing protein, partial [Candidatus Sumerlaeota bacterium]|nr:cohesin domain-containing protein [Candidatus Sumerlaeota bacterium]